MAFDYISLRENPKIDPAMVEKILRNPTMVKEQGSSWLSGWGGPSLYMTLAKLPLESRLVYAAVLEGFTDTESIQDVTGLPSQAVSKGLTYLQDTGLVVGTSEAEVI